MTKFRVFPDDSPSKQQAEPSSNPISAAPAPEGQTTTTEATSTSTTNPAQATTVAPVATIPPSDTSSKIASSDAAKPAAPASIFKSLRFNPISKFNSAVKQRGTTESGGDMKSGQQAELSPLLKPIPVNSNSVDVGSVVVNIPGTSFDQPVKISNSAAMAKEEDFWFFKDELPGSIRTGPVDMKEFEGGRDGAEGIQNPTVYQPAKTLFSVFFGGGTTKTTKSAKEEAPIDPNAHKVPFNNLEEEIKLFLPKVHVVRLLDRFVLFRREEEASLFKEIRKYQKKSPLATRSDAFETFGSKMYGEALIRIAYNEHMDQFMAYRNFDFFGKNLEKYRYQFFEKMVQQDLILILDVADVQSDRRREICICCPFDRLLQEAHNIKLRLPLTSSQISQHIKQFEARIKPIDQRWFKVSNTYRYTSQCRVKRSTIFDKTKITHFVGGSDPPEQLYQTFFNPMHRSFLIQSIINKISITRDSIFTAQAAGGTGKDGRVVEQNASDLLKTWFISDLLSKNLITKWIPLHSHKQLLELRARYKSFFKTIGPVTIRNYFGEEVAFYFAWVQFYTEWCIIICIPGLVAVGWGVAFSAGTVNLSLSQTLSLFDNSSTLLFAFTLNLFSILFLKFWKRRNHMLSFLWDVSLEENVSTAEEGEHEVRIGWVPSKKLIYSPINGEMIPFESDASKVSRKLVSFFGIMSCILGLALVIAANVALQSYNENIGSFGIGFIDQFGQTGNAAFASVVSAIAIVLLSFVFDWVVLKLIQFENHRTLKTHLNHYIWVQFLLQFINSYGLLIFTACMRPIFYYINPSISYLFGPLTCQNQGSGGTCMQSLVLSVSITFIIQNFIFQLIGWVSLVYGNSKMKIAESKAKSVYQLDKRMKENTSESFEKVYNSRIVQFGYLVLFSSAFPIGSILALINNFFQGKLNGNEYLYSYSRPFVVRSNGIGSWHTIATSLVILGIVVNGLSLPFISDGFYYATGVFYSRGLLDKTNYRFHQVLFVVVYEHLLLICYALVETLIQDVPECVRVGRLSENYILKERSVRADEVDVISKADGGLEF